MAYIKHNVNSIGTQVTTTIILHLVVLLQKVVRLKL